MHWEFTSDTPLTAHTLRAILNQLPGATPICLAMADDWDSEPATEIDFELAVRVGPCWVRGTDDSVGEKAAVLTIRS